mgnify:CR=1 FL=1
MELLRALVDELDGPADLDVERAWLETSQRRCRELVEGQVEGIPGPKVFQRLRDRSDPLALDDPARGQFSGRHEVCTAGLARPEMEG